MDNLKTETVEDLLPLTEAQPSLDEFKGVKPVLPPNVILGHTVNNGDCFFDSVAQGLKLLKPELDITIKSLREACKEYARTHLNIEESWLKKVLLNEAEQIDLYIARIEYTANDIKRKFGSVNVLGLTLPIWGRSDIEGTIISQLFDVNIHVIKEHKGVWVDLVIDQQGSRCVDIVDYTEENTIHLINKGNLHFKPLFVTDHQDKKASQPAEEIKIPDEKCDLEDYSGSGIKSSLHGAVYQLKLLMLFLKRGLDNGYCFYLATEMDAAEKFDDIVFQYNEHGQKVHVFVQAKHRQDENKKIKVDDLLPIKKDGDFNLIKYFMSFLKIKCNPVFLGSNLKDFYICTNIHFDVDQSLKIKASGQHKGKEIFVTQIDDENDFFKEEGLRFKLIFTSPNIIVKLQSLFKNALEEEVNKLKKGTEVVEKKSDTSSDDSRGKNTNKNEAKKNGIKIPNKILEKNLENRRMWQKEFEDIIDNPCRLECITKEFFDKLIFAVGHPNETKLAEIIKNELGEYFNKIDKQNVYARFLEEMLDWLKDKKGRFLTHTDGSDFFSRMKEEIYGNFRFNVRSPVQSFVGREEQLENLHKLICQDKSMIISQPISISGLGGIGKTELARKYIEKYGENYDENIIWINSETYGEIKQSFLEIARDLLGISTKDKDLECIVRDIYLFFSKRKCLFVFDNAEKYRNEEDGDSGINVFLPSYFLGPNTDKPSVLITSRNQNWGCINVILLGTLTDREAVEFIKKELDIQNNTEDKEVLKLSKKLQCFPLALQQAVAYIKERNVALRNVGEEFKISNYLQRYDEETKRLLDFKFPDSSSDLYTKTTFTTWRVTMEKIYNNPEYGLQAIQILNIISYFAPDNIPVKTFLSTEPIDYNKEKLGNVIQLLKIFSMLKSEQDQTMVSIHRLVQQVIRINLKHQNREMEVLEQALQMFGYHVGITDVEHAMSVWEFASEYDTLCKLQSNFPVLIVNSLHKTCRYEEAYLFGLKAVKFLERIHEYRNMIALIENIMEGLCEQGKDDDVLEMYEKLKEKQKNYLLEYRPFYVDIGIILKRRGRNDEALECFRSMYNQNRERNGILEHNMGLILLEQGHLNDSLKLFKEALVQMAKKVGSYSVHTFETKEKIATILKEQGKYDEALQMLWVIYKDKNEYWGKNNLNVLKTLDDLAFILCKQKKYNEALKISAKVLDITKLLKPEYFYLTEMLNVIKILLLQENYDKALMMCKKHFQNHNILRSNHPDTTCSLIAWYDIAITLAKEKKYDESLMELNEIRITCGKILKPCDGNVFIIRDAIDKVSKAQKNGSEISPRNDGLETWKFWKYLYNTLLADCKGN